MTPDFDSAPPQSQDVQPREPKQVPPMMMHYQALPPKRIGNAEVVFRTKQGGGREPEPEPDDDLP